MSGKPKKLTRVGPEKSGREGREGNGVKGLSDGNEEIRRNGDIGDDVFVDQRLLF